MSTEIENPSSPMPLDGSASDETATKELMYNINMDILDDLESKSPATSILMCLAAVRNRWSTDEELAAFYEKFRPGGRAAVINVREKKQEWNRRAKKSNLGHSHNEDDSFDSEGCTIADAHRVCKRLRVIGKRVSKGKDGEDKTTDMTVEESRIHPAFAAEIFSEGDKTVDEIAALPTRNYKRKRPATEEAGVNSEDEDHITKIKENNSAQKRLLTRLKRKLTEADKIWEELMEVRNHHLELEEGVQEKEREFRMKTKGKLPTTTKSNKRQRQSDTEDSAAGPSHTAVKVTTKPKKNTTTGQTDFKGKGKTSETEKSLKPDQPTNRSRSSSPTPSLPSADESLSHAASSPSKSHDDLTDAELEEMSD